VICLLADENIQGHVTRLVARMQREPWREFWDHLGLRAATFTDVGLDRAASDAALWEHCQQHRLLLLTSNRNEDGPDSLGATIRNRNTPESLPVFTIGDADRLLAEGDYADRVIDRLIRYLLEIETLRGTGRLFLP
jgi:hypothetical protein